MKLILATLTIIITIELFAITHLAHQLISYKQKAILYQTAYERVVAAHQPKDNSYYPFIIRR